MIWFNSSNSPVLVSHRQQRKINTTCCCGRCTLGSSSTFPVVCYPGVTWLSGAESSSRWDIYSSDTDGKVKAEHICEVISHSVYPNSLEYSIHLKITVLSCIIIKSIRKKKSHWLTELRQWHSCCGWGGGKRVRPRSKHSTTTWTAAVASQTSSVPQNHFYSCMIQSSQSRNGVGQNDICLRSSFQRGHRSSWTLKEAVREVGGWQRCKQQPGGAGRWAQLLLTTALFWKVLKGLVGGE